MLLGAGIAGVLTAFLASTIQRLGKVHEDASLGVVFTTMFAIGSILLTFFAGSIDLDPGCVLYGVIETAVLHRTEFLGMELPRPTVAIGLALLIDLVLVIVFFKELRIVSFDPYLATTMGISAGVVHYCLMAAVAGTSVVMFESVGSILAVAMLVAPAATAQLLTDRLRSMVVVSVVMGVSAGVLGHVGAVYWNTSVAGMVSVVAGAQFAVAVVAAPRHGLVGKWYRRLHLSTRIAAEDILGRMYREAESGTRERDVRTATLLDKVALIALRQARLVVNEADALSLTPKGQAAAQDLIRGHRLWEKFLAEKVGLPLDHLHDPSHRVEHYLSGAIKAQLEEGVEAATDPHGKPIPPAPGAG
jgi:manganese/zinc/iron transport system permease protein